VLQFDGPIVVQQLQQSEPDHGSSVLTRSDCVRIGRHYLGTHGTLLESCHAVAQIIASVTAKADGRQIPENIADRRATASRMSYEILLPTQGRPITDSRRLDFGTTVGFLGSGLRVFGVVVSTVRGEPIRNDYHYDGRLSAATVTSSPRGWAHHHHRRPR